MTRVTRVGRLWVARHAKAIDTTICYGQTDIAVTLAPDIAAKTLLQSYGGDVPTHVWSSPLSRCRLPASHLADCLGTPHTILDALSELHFGTWEGRPWTTITAQDHDSYEAWMMDWQRTAPPRGETPSQIEERVRAWYRSLPHDAVHLLVAHSGVVRALHVIVHGRTWTEALAVPVTHLAWAEFPLVETR